jgi:hypothetical protein
MTILENSFLRLLLKSNALFTQTEKCYTERVMKVFFRIPKGWSKPIENESKNTCDIDGAKLWIGPGDQIYCDSDHNPKDVLTLKNWTEK